MTNYQKAARAHELERAAAKACKEINTDNPVAAAEAMPDLFTACKRAIAAAENPDDWIEGAAAYEALKSAIKKATAKD